jgi:hypothetical protein
MIVGFRRPAADAAMLAPGMAFGGGVIRQIHLDEIPDGPQAYDPYVIIEVEVPEQVPDPRFAPRPWRP